MNQLILRYFKKINFKQQIISYFLIIFYSLSLAISAKIKFYLPFSIVPFTLQMLVIFLIIFFEDKKIAFFSILTYLCLGLLNLPFFANVSGIQAILGPTGGYLLGFLFSSLVASDKRKSLTQENVNFVKLFTKGVFVILIVYLFGFLGLLRFIDFKKAFLIGVLPFIIFDFYKLFIALFIYAKLNYKGLRIG